MQKAYRAVSSAIYGREKDSLVMSTSVVAAYGEDDIRLELTDKQPIDTASPDSVRTRFGDLLATLVDTVRRQKATYGALSVPVVFGVPKNFKGLDLTDTLRAAYANVLGLRPVPDSGKEKKKAKEPLLPPGMNMNVARFLAGASGMRDGRPLMRKSMLPKPAETKDNDDEEGHGGVDDVWGLDKRLVEHLMRNACADRGGKANKRLERYKYDMTFHPRLFQPIDHGMQEQLTAGDAVERMMARAETLRPGRGADYTRLHALAEAGDQASLARLREMAKEDARSVATAYMERIPMAGRPLSRFIMLAPPMPPYTTAPEYNFLQWFDLRKVFGAEFARLMGLRHPVCVKGPGDAPSPAFADVAATYAFQLLKKAETRRNEVNGTVMITSRADQQPQPPQAVV